MPRRGRKQRARGQTEPSGPPPPVLKAGDVEDVDIPAKKKSKTLEDIHNELEFSQWYTEVEDDLLEASYDEYQ